MDEHFDGSDAQLLVTCPKCGRQWLPPCEQTICIERHGECIPCRFVPVGGEINKHGSGEGTTEEIDAISAAAKLGAGETATKSLCDMTEADFDAVHNGEVRGASRPAGEASSAEGATSTVVLGAERPRKE